MQIQVHTCRRWMICVLAVARAVCNECNALHSKRARPHKTTGPQRCTPIQLHRHRPRQSRRLSPRSSSAPRGPLQEWRRLFRALGGVRGDQTVRIDFTSSQLNDVLQSLTVLDLNGGHISGVNYNSEAPLSQRLGTLRLPLAEQTDVSKFYWRTARRPA